MSYKEAMKIFSLNDNFSEDDFKNKYSNLIKEEKDVQKLNEAKLIIENYLNKLKLLEYKEKFKTELEKLKIKYIDTEISKIANIYENNIDSFSNILDLENEKKKFYEIINKLKKEIILPNLKEKQLEWLKKKVKGHQKEIENLTKEYYLITKEAKSLEELNSIKQKYNYLYDKLLIKEKEQIKEYITFKDNVKRSLLYHFYKYSYNASISNILQRHDLLLSMLLLLDISTIYTIEDIYNLIRGVDYNNIKEESNKFKILYLEYTKNMTTENIKNITEINKKLNINNNQLESVKQELVNKILESYYTSCTNKNTSIEKIIKEKDKFIDLMNTIKECSVETVEKVNLYKENSWKRYKMLLDSVEDFQDPSQIYIERETGNICIIKEYNKKVYTIYLSGDVKKDNIEKREIIWKYISLYNFFRVSYYTDGKVLEEVSSKNNIVLFDYYANDLYYTNDLLLRFIDNQGKKEFKFIPVKEKYQFYLTEKDQMVENNNFDKYKDKDACLLDFLDFIKNKQDNKIETKTI